MWGQHGVRLVAVRLVAVELVAVDPAPVCAGRAWRATVTGDDHLVGGASDRS
jgi:hypothetical protein